MGVQSHRSPMSPQDARFWLRETWGKALYRLVLPGEAQAEPLSLCRPGPSSLVLAGWLEPSRGAATRARGPQRPGPPAKRVPVSKAKPGLSPAPTCLSLGLNVAAVQLRPAGLSQPVCSPAAGLDLANPSTPPVRGSFGGEGDRALEEKSGAGEAFRRRSS